MRYTKESILKKCDAAMERIHLFYIDEDEVVIVREIFERYVRGETVADIIKDLNVRQIKTPLGRDLNKNSLQRLLRSKRSTKESTICGGCFFHAKNEKHS